MMERKPSSKEIEEFLKNKISNLKEAVGTVAISLDGVKNQIKPILQDIQVVEQAISQLSSTVKEESEPVKKGHKDNNPVMKEK